MSFPFTVFIPYNGNLEIRNVINSLRASQLIEEIYIITPESIEVPKSTPVLKSENVLSSSSLKSIYEETDSDYIILFLKPWEITFEKLPK